MAVATHKLAALKQGLPPPPCRLQLLFRWETTRPESLRQSQRSCLLKLSLRCSLQLASLVARLFNTAASNSLRLLLVFSTPLPPTRFACCSSHAVIAGLTRNLHIAAFLQHLQIGKFVSADNSNKTMIQETKNVLYMFVIEKISQILASSWIYFVCLRYFFSKVSIATGMALDTI